MSRCRLACANQTSSRRIAIRSVPTTLTETPGTVRRAAAVQHLHPPCPLWTHSLSIAVSAAIAVTTGVEWRMVFYLDGSSLLLAWCSFLDGKAEMQRRRVP